MENGIKVLSLFDGISCGQIALERAGIKVDKYYASEIKKHAIKVTMEHFPNTIQIGDVTKVSYNDGILYTENGEFNIGNIDLLIGGSPCQDFSSINPKGEGLKGDKSRLFYEYLRLLNEIKPKYFLLENVKMKKVNEKQLNEYMKVDGIHINSNLVSYQNRARIYWTNIPNVTIPEDKGITCYDVVDFSTHDFRPIGEWVWSYWGETQKIDTLKTIKSEKSHTLTTPKTHSMGYYLSEDKKTYCNLTVNDYEALQTLPIGYVDNVKIKSTSKYRAIGNGWTVDVIAHILKGVI